MISTEAILSSAWVILVLIGLAALVIGALTWMADRRDRVSLNVVGEYDAGRGPVMLALRNRTPDDIYLGTSESPFYVLRKGPKGFETTSHHDPLLHAAPSTRRLADIRIAAGATRTLFWDRRIFVGGQLAAAPAGAYRIAVRYWREVHVLNEMAPSEPEGLRPAQPRGYWTEAVTDDFTLGNGDAIS